MAKVEVVVGMVSLGSKGWGCGDGKSLGGKDWGCGGGISLGGKGKFGGEGGGCSGKGGGGDGVEVVVQLLSIPLYMGIRGWLWKHI